MVNDRIKARELIRQYQAQQGILDNLLDPAFTKQTSLINDPCRLKAALCTRRSGKSYGAGLYLYKEALENPGVSLVYIGLTRDTAKRTMWKDIFKVINRKHKLSATFNEVELSIKLPNGSIIYLVGANANKDEPDKLLGQKYKLAVIDECASFDQDLRNLVMSVLKPAMVDHQGTICMFGTPGNTIKGFFFEVTTGKEAGWSVHHWSAHDNPYVAKAWEKDIAKLVSDNPLIVETPAFKQHYLGLWFIDTDKLVYRFREDRNVADVLPPARYFYVLGVDLGYNDASAFVVAAYSEHDNNLYIVETLKRKKMIISHVVDAIKDFQRRYSIHKIIVDSSAKQSVEEMRQRYGLPLESAEKKDKAGFIDMMNSDLITGKIKIVGAQDELRTEWGLLVWDDRSERRIENSACQNHLCDATLYAWRYSHNYLATVKLNASENIYSEAYIDRWWDKQAKESQKGTLDHWAKEFGFDWETPSQ